jgi:hypothetical protein
MSLPPAITTLTGLQVILDANGNATYIFNGIIIASAVELEMGGVPAQASDSLFWVTPTTSTVRALISGAQQAIFPSHPIGQTSDTLWLEIDQDGAVGSSSVDMAVVAVLRPRAGSAHGVVHSVLYQYNPTTGALTSDFVFAGQAPGTLLDSNAILSPVTIVGTSEATSTPIITGNSVTYDGSAVRVTFFAPSINILVGNNGSVTYVVYVDSTVIGQVGPVSIRQAGAQVSGIQTFSVAHIPSAGAHTYSVAAFGSAAASSYAVGAGSGGSGNPVRATLAVSLL